MYKRVETDKGMKMNKNNQICNAYSCVNIYKTYYTGKICKMCKN